MKTKELDQFLCDYFQHDEEIAVNSKWLQSKLMENESLKHVIKALSHQNDLLKSLVVVKDYDAPKYRLNVKG